MNRLTMIPARRMWLALVFAMLFSFVAADGGIANPLPSGQAGTPAAQAAGSFGAAKSMTEKVNQTSLPPTRISLMPYRHLALQYAFDGYRRSHVPLVAFDGDKYLVAGFSDDPGIYYFIPRVAARTGLSVESAINLFFGGILVVSFLLGMIGLLVTMHGWPVRLWAIFALCMLLWFTYRKGDVYVALSAPAVAIVPWFLYLVRKNVAGAVMGLFLFGVGLLAGFANQIRSYAATGLLIFIVILVAFELKRAWGLKVALFAALLIGFAVAPAYFHGLIVERDAYLTGAVPGYSETVNQHPIWHTVYTGLGFTKNPYVAGYRDEVAADEVYSVSPSTPYLSAEYERILRDESFRIARTHPLFILLTLAAKLRIVLFLLLCWCNVGLLAAALYPKGWAVESAFWGALAFTSLFGIIAIPQVQYMLGFVAFSTLYGLVSLDWALRRRQLALAKYLASARS